LHDKFENGGEMGVIMTISSYLAKDGEEDAIIALHEDWERTQRPQAQGYISGELLRNCTNTHIFLAILRFENWESAQAYRLAREQDGWYQRLVNLTEEVLPDIDYMSEWQSH
jgi:antibiotic biosynthesis monooxygenase (ABM) superfamily enzyme